MEKLKAIIEIESKLLNEPYILSFDCQGYEAQSPLDDDFANYIQYAPFQKRIYRNSKNIILFESDDFYPATIYDIDEIIKDCFLINNPNKTTSDNFYEAIDYLNKNENCILKIYWFDDPIRFCLIDDKKLFKNLVPSLAAGDKNEHIIHSINEYIVDAIFMSGYPIHHDEAIIVDGVYRKYKNEKTRMEAHE